MIHSLVGLCFMLGLSTASPLSKGAYAPAPPGGRPPCAVDGMTFCEKVDKYPTKLIQKLLQFKTYDKEDFFTDESEGLDEPPEHFLHQEMTLEEDDRDRKPRSIGSVSVGDQLSDRCVNPGKLRAPRIASNRKGEWRFISQDELLKVQRNFKVQLCRNSTECQKSCTQFYAPVPMLSIDSSGKTAEETFWMPSSCRCFDISDNVV